MAYDLIVSNARLLDRPDLADVAVREGRIEGIGSGLAQEIAVRRLDAAGNLVVPPFAEPHFHLDKTLSRGHFAALDYEQGFRGAREVKVNFTVEDVEARACAALRLAAMHGIGALRAQCDVDSFTRLVSLEGVLAARDRFRGVVDVQVVAFPQEGIVADPETPALLQEALAMGADLLGGLPEIEQSREDQVTHIRTILDLAEANGVPADLHLDYVDDPELKTLEAAADLTIERGLQGRIVGGHASALAVYPDDEARRVIDKVLAAQMPLSVMPMGNLQKLGGAKRTGYNRGSSRMAELLDAGVEIAAATDNMSDIWYAFNGMDPAELGLITVLSGRLRTDDEVRAGFEMTNVRAARVMGLDVPGITPGAPADFVVLNGSTVEEFLRNLPGRRVLVRGGRVVAGMETDGWIADQAPAGSGR